MTEILNAKNDELRQLASRLQASSATLEDTAVRQSLNSDFAGFVGLSRAYGELVSNVAKRVQDGREWSDKMIDGVEFTARHIGQTDAQIAQSIIKTSRSFSDVVFSLGPLLWNGKFGQDDDVYQESGRSTMHVPAFTLFAQGIPGSPDGIFAFTTVLRGKAKAGGTVFVAVRQSDELAPSQRGTSADGYVKSKDVAAGDFMNLTDGPYKAAGALDGYAWSSKVHQSTAAEYKTTLENYDRRLEQAPISQKGQVCNSLLSAAEEVRDSLTTLVKETEADMRVCAAELRNCLHIKALDYDEHENNHGHQHRLNDTDIARINSRLNRLDPSTVGRGRIGDCYYLAALGALISTEKGRRHVRSCIRTRYDESRRQDGCLMMVYNNPFHPKTSRSRTVFVADVYEHSAIGDGSKPSVASLFEAAYGQIHPGGTRNSTDKQPDIDGGVAPKSFRHITGGNTHDVHPQRGPHGEFHYDDHKRQQIIRAAKTKTVVANTDKGMPGYSNKGEDHTIVEIDGKKQDMKTLPGHVYTLTCADMSGVTLRNPWGHNDLVNGGHAGAGFKMSWKQFETYCNSATIGEIP